jgi:hypothetical protein
MADKQEQTTAASAAIVEQTVAESEAPGNSDHPYHYVVRHDFEQYRRGDRITEPDAIAELLAGSNLHHCVRVYPQ